MSKVDYDKTQKILDKIFAKASAKESISNTAIKSVVNAAKEHIARFAESSKIREEKGEPDAPRRLEGAEEPDSSPKSAKAKAVKEKAAQKKL